MSVVISSVRDMRAYIVSLVQRKVKCLSLSSDATYQEVVAALGFPPVRFERMPNGCFGRRHGNQIAVNSDMTFRERIEFTVFHEILHILIDIDGNIDSALLEHLEHGSNHYVWNIEDFCNLGAAEWIMPSQDFRELMDAKLWKLASLRCVTEIFRCSLMAAAFQFAHWNPDPCHVVVCEAKWIAPREEPSLALQPSSRSLNTLMVTHTVRNDTKYAMRRNVPVPQDHLIDRAWRDGNPIEGKAQGFFHNPCGVMDSEAVPFGSRVYSVFYERQRRWVSPHSQPSLNFDD